MGIFSFVGRMFGSSNNSASAGASPRRGLDPVNPPYNSEVFFVKELYEYRGRNLELGVAIAAKVGAWRLLYQMGSPQAIPSDFRQFIVNAEQDPNPLERVIIYCTIQKVLFKNFSDPEVVKRL